MKLLFDVAKGSLKSDEADILAVLIDEYEKRNYHIDAPDPIEAIKIRMEKMCVKQTNLVDCNGWQE